MAIFQQNTPVVDIYSDPYIKKRYAGQAQAIGSPYSGPNWQQNNDTSSGPLNFAANRIASDFKNESGTIQDAQNKQAAMGSRPDNPQSFVQPNMVSNPPAQQGARSQGIGTKLPEMGAMPQSLGPNAQVPGTNKNGLTAGSGEIRDANGNLLAGHYENGNKSKSQIGIGQHGNIMPSGVIPTASIPMDRGTLAMRSRPKQVDEPTYITPEQAKEMGMGWHARIAYNDRISRDYQEKLRAAGEEAGQGTQASLANARNSASTGIAENNNATTQAIAGQRMQGEANIAGSRNQAAIQTAGIGKQLNPLQQQLFDLRKEYFDPNTTTARKKEIESQLRGLSGKTTQKPTIFYTEDNAGTKIPNALYPGGETKRLSPYPFASPNVKDRIVGQIVRSPSTGQLITWNGKGWETVKQ